MKNTVALVAPVAPFRGGIARHSQAWAEVAARRNDTDLRITSFSRLYPPMFYPGNADRDPGRRPPEDVSVAYTIDAVDPRSWSRAAQEIARTKPTLTIMPAWTFFVAPALGWIARGLRRRNIPVMMIVHNVADHESSRWKSCLLDWQLAGADGFITHTDELARQLREADHRQPTVVCHHTAYSDFPHPTGALPREHALELLCFGLVRRYKGVDIALRALAASQPGDVRLTIAGEVWDDRESINRLAEDPVLRGKVELIDRYVSDAEAAELFGRCDAVLAPYRSVTGSGVAALARHYRRPLIAPDLAGFRETIEHGRTGWLFPPNDENALAALLHRTVTRESASAMAADLAESGREDGWQYYCQSSFDLMERLKKSSGESV